MAIYSQVFSTLPGLMRGIQLVSSGLESGWGIVPRSAAYTQSQYGVLVVGSEIIASRTFDTGSGADVIEARCPVPDPSELATLVFDVTLDAGAGTWWRCGLADSPMAPGAIPDVLHTYRDLLSAAGWGVGSGAIFAVSHQIAVGLFAHYRTGYVFCVDSRTLYDDGLFAAGNLVGSIWPTADAYISRSPVADPDNSDGNHRYPEITSATATDMAQAIGADSVPRDVGIVLAAAMRQWVDREDAARQALMGARKTERGTWTRSAPQIDPYGTYPMLLGLAESIEYAGLAEDTDVDGVKLYSPGVGVR